MSQGINLDKIVTRGRVVTPSGVVKADVGIRGGKVAAVGAGLAANAAGARLIDARGCLVLPGVIDAHTHLELSIGPGLVSCDDFLTGTRAAARGGVTTIIDFATPARKAGGETYESMSEALDARMKLAEGRAMADYSFHVCITNWESHGREMRAIARRGCPTFKMFTIYADRGLSSDDAAIFRALESARDLGAMITLHAESPSVLALLVGRMHTRALMKKYGARLHAMTRPNFIEAEAVARAVCWSRATACPLHIVHMSTGEGAEIIGKAQARGVRVMAETCPQYLVLDDSVFARRDGHLYACSPQVKKPEDSRRLWEGLRDGEIAMLATDTCAFTRSQKAAWNGDFTRIPMGLPGLETLLPIAYTHGVLKKRLTLERMCACLSENPARIMGLWPQKGAIAPGADADIVIIDPSKTMRVDAQHMETNAGWSPYQGWELAGFPRVTISRGEVIVDDYKVIGREGRGQWLPRRLP
ncbi:MAG: dihydropyrimidinase [bacterium]